MLKHTINRELTHSCVQPAAGLGPQKVQPTVIDFRRFSRNSTRFGIICLDTVVRASCFNSVTIQPSHVNLFRIKGVCESERKAAAVTVLFQILTCSFIILPICSDFPAAASNQKNKKLITHHDSACVLRAQMLVTVVAVFDTALLLCLLWERCADVHRCDSLSGPNVQRWWKMVCKVAVPTEHTVASETDAICHLLVARLPGSVTFVGVRLCRLTVPSECENTFFLVL